MAHFITHGAPVYRARASAHFLAATSSRWACAAAGRAATASNWMRDNGVRDPNCTAKSRRRKGRDAVIKRALAEALKGAGSRTSRLRRRARSASFSAPAHRRRGGSLTREAMLIVGGCVRGESTRRVRQIVELDPLLDASDRFVHANFIMQRVPHRRGHAPPGASAIRGICSSSTTNTPAAEVGSRGEREGRAEKVDPLTALGLNRSTTSTGHAGPLPARTAVRPPGAGIQPPAASAGRPATTTDSSWRRWLELCATPIAEFETLTNGLADTRRCSNASSASTSRTCCRSARPLPDGVRPVGRRASRLIEDAAAATGSSCLTRPPKDCSIITPTTSTAITPTRRRGLEQVLFGLAART